MKVKELLSLLQYEDPEMRVVVSAYEGGFDELKEIQKVCIIENPDKKNPKYDKWWLGEFEQCLNGPYDEYAILLPRTS